MIGRSPASGYATLCVLLAALAVIGCTSAGTTQRVWQGPQRQSSSVRATPMPSSPHFGAIAPSGISVPMEPGACVEEPPSAGNRHQVVFLDPGHGGADPGTEGETPDGTPVAEKQVTLMVATLLAQRLRADGYTVVLSRTGDTLSAQLPADDRNPDGSLTPEGVRTDLEARVACANSAHAAVLLAIHFNGFDDPTAAGSTTFDDPARSFAERNLALAQAVQSALVDRLHQAGWDTEDRGIESDSDVDAPALTPADADYLHFIELGPATSGVTTVASTMPGALVEPLFLTNPAEAAVAASADGQQTIAAGLCQGIQDFLGG